MGCTGPGKTTKEKNMTKREILKETELFVLDMDGTFLSGYRCD